MRTGVPITGEVTLTEPSDWKQTKAFDTIPELSTGVVEFESGNVPRLNTKYVAYTVKTDQGDEYEFAKSVDFSVAALRDMNLPDETYVVHGHGVDSTIKMLRHHNPFFGGENCGCCHHCDCGGDCGCK